MIEPNTIVAGRYKILRELGRGGMGEVYEAENVRMGRRVALKSLRAELTSNEAVKARFLREARAAATLRHAHIVDVLDVDFDEALGATFIVQELLEGESFDALLKRCPERRLDPAQAIKLLLPVMSALDVCHRAGVIHRDVKPSNVFLVHAPGGVVVPKLIDFGVSKALVSDDDAASQTATGVSVGTPRFMAPEQARGDRDVDARADVWSLGATLFEALTGERLYPGGNSVAVLAKVIYEPPRSIAVVLPSLPGDLAAVVDHALAHDRERRLPSMRAFIDSLLECELCQSPHFRAELDTASLARDMGPTPSHPAVRSNATSSSVVPLLPTSVEPEGDAAQPTSLSADITSSSNLTWTKAPPADPRRRYAALALVPLGLLILFVAWRARDPSPPPPTAITAPALVAAPAPTPAVALPPEPVAPPPVVDDVPAAPIERAATRTSPVPSARRGSAPRADAGALHVPTPRPHTTPEDPLRPDETPYQQIARPPEPTP